MGTDNDAAADINLLGKLDHRLYLINAVFIFERSSNNNTMKVKGENVIQKRFRIFNNFVHKVIRTLRKRLKYKSDFKWRNPFQ